MISIITNVCFVCNRRKKNETQKLAFLEDEMCHDVEYWRQSSLNTNWIDYTWITNIERAWFNPKEWNLYSRRRRLNQIDSLMNPQRGSKDMVTTKKKQSRLKRDSTDERKQSDDSLSYDSPSNDSQSS